MRINLRSPTTQKWVILCGLLFGIAYGYVNVVHNPRQQKAMQLGEEIARENELLTKGKRIAVNYRNVQDDYARLMQSWEVAHELLPTEKEMEDLLKSVTLAGQERDVSFLLFKPLEPIEKPYYWENPIQVKTLSTYHDLADFLTAVGSLDRIVNIHGLKLGAFRPGKGRSPYTVEAEFTASIYIFKELGAPPKPPAEDAAATPAADAKPAAKGKGQQA